ncbi:hypothetical protein DWX58_02625 [Pseudoflavonifractor sp. AF19-9AC]|uniref:SoxR reducing system RseC family protein n=1 Tax=Pseudoflavonifractor sp. AF19-9AC TaxID=2292244 RepID=UPI000E491B7B|nr:SoxR reducing system RseC family protein [Pseudoflavonifractor sp. AF19-9AC]RHR11353.1 hypothetical protein DWX58_02625 [Pseudoflavonifractor sp. AF19-9AC]
MVQNAIVKRIVQPGVAEVSLLRQMECGLHCDGACAGCSQKPKEEILALASNSIGAQPGDHVEVEPTSRHNIGISVVAFGVPCVGLGMGYVLGQSLLGLGEGMALLTAVAGLAVGCLPAILMNRAMVRSAAPEFSILKFLR